MSAAETAALASPQFANGPLLMVGMDADYEARRLAALNGVDAGPTYGAAYSVSAYPGCTIQAAQANIGAEVKGYAFTGDAVALWLRKEGYLTTEVYSISYPNASMVKSYGNLNVFYCPELTESFREAIQKVQQVANIHNYVNVPIAHRTLDRWTFENQYAAPYPGKGNVTVFAGTLAYHMVPAFPGISFSGSGTASIKMYLDPDTGTWDVDSFYVHDPSMSLDTH